MRQGCPLASYLLIIVAEVMNAMIVEEIDNGNVRGIHLPIDGRQ